MAVDSFGRLARDEAGYRKLYTSDYILDEAVTACRRRTKSHTLAVKLGTDIILSKSIVMLRVDEKILEESWRLYTEKDDVNLSFTDATCATLARARGISDIFTFNAREFRPLNLNVITSL